jgi:integrase
VRQGGARPRHLVRRGAIYAVRFRIPADLTQDLGLVEIQKSIHTADPQIARRRGALANLWFGATIGPFRSRLTDLPEKQVKSATYLRYWNAACAFFAWCRSEGYIEFDATDGLTIEKRRGETKRTPKPFTTAEIQQLFKTPIFAGYRSASRLSVPGSCRVRAGHWWAVILLMFTGMRAGELSQLLPGDFVFDAEIPHVKIREEDDGGLKVKSTKNAASIRDVPLHPELLRLGLREFVKSRIRKPRVFGEFRLGTRGRTADGMTRFWRDYLARFGLASEGRATHVFRHTLVACLRENGASDEDIGAFVGHSGRTITSAYGGGQGCMPLRFWCAIHFPRLSAIH